MTRGHGATIGVLALQGYFEAHASTLARIGVPHREVRLPEDLEGLSGLVIPGGESSALIRLMREYGLDAAISRFAEGGGAILGTCAGAILLARTVTHPSQWSLGLMDIEVQRNAYGRQIDSFETVLTEAAPEVLRDPESGRDGGPLPAVFIRAPRILRCGAGTGILAAHEGEPVLVRQHRFLAATFHPELTADSRIHRYFVETLAAGSAVRIGPRPGAELRRGAAPPL